MTDKFLIHYRNKLNKIKNFKHPVNSKLFDVLLTGAIKLQKFARRKSDVQIKKETINLFFSWIKVILATQNQIQPDDENKKQLFENLILTISGKMPQILYESCTLLFWHYHVVDMWFTLLSSCSTEGLMKRILVHPKILYNLWSLIHFTGHYGTQKLILRILIKMLDTLDCSTKYSLIKTILKNEEFIKSLLHLNSENFDDGARALLNEFNLNICDDCTVYSIEVESIIFGDFVINNLLGESGNQPNVQWINFNSSPKSISFDCSFSTFGISSNKLFSFELILSKAIVQDRKLIVKSNNKPILIPHYDELPITILDIRQIEFSLSQSVANDLKSKEDLFTYINESQGPKIFTNESFQLVSSRDCISPGRQQSDFDIQESDCNNIQAKTTNDNDLPVLFESNEKTCDKILLSVSEEPISTCNTTDKSYLLNKILTDSNETNKDCKLIGTSNRGKEIRYSNSQLTNNVSIDKNCIQNSTNQPQSLSQPIMKTNTNINCESIENHQIKIPAASTTMANVSLNGNKRKLYTENLPSVLIACEQKKKKLQNGNGRLINLVKPLIAFDYDNDDTGTIIDINKHPTAKVCNENVLNGVVQEISEIGGFLKVQNLLKDPKTMSHLTESQLNIIKNNLCTINTMTESSADRLKLNLNDISELKSLDVYDNQNICSTVINNIVTQCKNADPKEINNEPNEKAHVSEPKNGLNNRVSFSYRNKKYLDIFEAEIKEQSNKYKSIRSKRTAMGRPKKLQSRASNLKKTVKKPTRSSKRICNTTIGGVAVSTNTIAKREALNSSKRQPTNLEDAATENKTTPVHRYKTRSISKNANKNVVETVDHDNTFDALKNSQIIFNLSGQSDTISIYSDSNNNYKVYNNLDLSDVNIRKALPTNSTPIILSNILLNKTMSPERLTAKHVENENNENFETGVEEIPACPMHPKEPNSGHSDTTSSQPIKIIASYQSAAPCNKVAYLEDEKSDKVSNCNDGELDWIIDRYFNSLSTQNEESLAMSCEIPRNPDFGSDESYFADPVSQENISLSNGTHQNKTPPLYQTRKTYSKKVLISTKRKSTENNDFQDIARKFPRIEPTLYSNGTNLNNFLNPYYQNLIDGFQTEGKVQAQEIKNNFIKSCRINKDKNSLRLAYNYMERMDKSTQQVHSNLKHVFHLHSLLEKSSMELKDALEKLEIIEGEGEELIKTLIDNVQRQSVIDNKYLKAKGTIENRLSSIRTQLWRRHVDFFKEKIVNKFKPFYELD